MTERVSDRPSPSAMRPAAAVHAGAAPAHSTGAAGARKRARGGALTARLDALRPRIPAAWRERAMTFWSARNPREQALLAGGGVVMALLLGYTLLWEPAAEGSAQLERSLPQLRAQLAEMETLSQEARGLAASPAPSLRGEALIEALRAGLGRHGLSPTRLAATGENTIQVQLEKAPFGAVAAWLQDVRQQQRFKVADAKIIYVGATAIVDVSATLQGPGGSSGAR